MLTYEWEKMWHKIVVDVGTHCRIAKVFILEGRTGSGPERQEEAKSFAATAPFVPFVLSSFQFNVKGRREREWLLSCANFFYQCGSRIRNFDRSYFGHMWLLLRGWNCPLTPLHVVPLPTEKEYWAQNKCLYLVGRILLLTFLKCSAWPCPGPA